MVTSYFWQVNGLDNKVRELETFKKIHEKDIKKLEGEISAYQGRIPTLEDSVKKLEDELRKAKNELEGETRVGSLYVFCKTRPKQENKP